MMKLSFVAFLAFVVAAIVAAQQDDCCLCDSCNAVPLSKEEVILLHSDESLGKTCGELELTLVDRTDVNDEECDAVRQNYEHVCCTEGFQGIDMFDHETLPTKGKVNNDEPQQQHEPEARGQSSYLRAVRKLWQTTSWHSSRSSTRTTSRAPARTFPATPQASSNSRYSTSYSSGSSHYSSSWSSSWSASGSSFSSFSNGNVGSSPSNTMNQQTGSQASAVASSTASTTSTVSDGNTATTTSETYSSDQSVTMVSAKPCTYEPVGVGFPTPGGNFGFGICRDGSKPIAAAQGVSMYDPNLQQMFSGDCHHIDELTRDGYMSNNLCGITRLQLDGKCCSNVEYTAQSLEESWISTPGAP